jgi:intracellular multiplication protein IcmQ
MAKIDEQRKTAREILHALDSTIEKGPWEKSIFLGTIGKKLKDIRFNFKNRLRFLDPGFEETDKEQAAAAQSSSSSNVSAAIPQPADDQIEAYISLYNVDGGNITKWEKILISLDKQVVTRPIYATEQAARASIRAKAVRKNDAYAAFYLSKADIITPKDGKPPLDRQGNPLLVLKDLAVKVPNITRFCHESGIYLFRNNSLSHIGDMNFMD